MDRSVAKTRGILMTAHPAPARLDPPALAARLASGDLLVDVRDPRRFGEGHVAGSLNVAVDSPQFGERVGWFVPPGRPLVLLAQSEPEVARALAALARVGLEDAVAGYAVGPEAVSASGLPTGTLENVTPPELSRRLASTPDLLVLDVREPAEWKEGHIPGARHVPMREIPARAAELPADRPIAVVCRGGQRSSLVASILLARGFRRLSNTWGGMGAWAEAGLPLARD